MQELKMQNGLLLQLINSKNRQNQILFQQYEQLAVDNQHLQALFDQLKAQNNQYKRTSAPPHHFQAASRPSPFDLEIADLKKKCTQYQSVVTELKAHLEQKGGAIVFLQSELQNAKLQAKSSTELDSFKQRFKQTSELLELKEKSMSELTEYMNEQAEKISDLTKAGIIAIENYEAKLTEKDKNCEDLGKEINELKDKIAQINAQKQEKQYETQPQIKDSQSNLQLQKVKQLETIILSKEQSVAELSEYLLVQSEKVSQLETNLSESNFQSLKVEIQNLKQINESKQKSILELSDFLNVLSEKNRQMQEKIQMMEVSNDQNQVQQKQQENEQQLLQNQIKELKQLLESKSNESDYHIKQVEILRARLSTKEDQVSRLSQHIQETESQISSLQIQLDQKILKITMLENISQQNEVQFPEDSNQQAINLVEQKVDAIPYNEEQIHQLQSIKEELLSKQKETQQLKQALQQKDQSLRDFTDFISQQTEKITQLQRKCEEAEEKAKNNEKILELETIIKSKEESINELSTYLEEAYAKVSNLQSNSLGSQENLIKLQSQIDCLRGQLSKSNKEEKQHQIKAIIDKEVQELNIKIAQLQSNIANKDLEIQSYRKNLTQKQEILEDRTQKIEQFNKSLESAQLKHEQPAAFISEPREEELRNQIVDLESIVASKSETIAELSEFMNQQAEELEQLRQKFEGTAEDQSGQSQQNMQTKIKMLEQILKSKEGSIAELGEFLQEAYTKISIIEEEKLRNDEQSSQLISKNEQLQNLVSSYNLDNQNIVIKLQKELQDINIKHQSQQQSDNLKKEQVSKEVEDIMNQIVQLKQDIDNKDQQIQQMGKQIKENQQISQDQLNMINLLTCQKNQLQKQVQERQEHNVPVVSEPREEELRSQIADLESILASKSETIAELSEFMNQQAEELEELREKVEGTAGGKNGSSQIDLQAKVMTLEQIIKSKEGSLAELGESLQEAYTKISAIEGENLINDSKNEQFTQLIRKNEELQKEILDLNAALKQENTILLENYKLQIETLTQNIEVANSKIRSLQATLSQNQTKYISNNPIDNLEELKATINDLQETITSKNQTIAELSEFMNEQSLKIQQLSQQVSPEGSTSNQNPAKLEEIQLILKSKEQSIVELAQYLEQTYSKITELQEQLNATQQELSDLKNQDTSNTKMEEQLENHLQEDKQILDNLRNAIQQREIKIQELDTEIIKKQGQISSLLQSIEQQSNKLSDLALQLEQAINSFNTLSSQMGEMNEQISSLMTQKSLIKRQYDATSQELSQIANKLEASQIEEASLRQEISKLQLNINNLKQQKEGQLKNANSPREDKSQRELEQNALVSRLQAKITQYQGYLNDKEEEMAAMMQVMESLQAEIQNKNQIIEHLQLRTQEKPEQIANNQFNSNQKDVQKIKEMEEEIMSLKQTIVQLQNRLENQQKQIILQEEYQKLEMDQQRLQRSQKIAHGYQQELFEMQNQEQLQKQLNLNQEFPQNEQNFSNNLDQIQNNEQLTVLQVIQQILVYSEEDSDLQSILRMIQVLKRSYLRENQCILKQNSQLKDTLNNLLEINSSLVEQLQKLRAEAQDNKNIIEEKGELIRELQEKIKKIENSHHQEIKQLRKSISGLKDESPINPKDQIQQDMMIISKLEVDIILLKQENQKKQIELQQLRANNNKKFVKELNNLLDSCTVNKQDEKDVEVEEQLEKVINQRDEKMVQCKEYEIQIANLQKKCLQLAISLENLNKNQPIVQVERKENADNSRLQHDSINIVNQMQGKLLMELQEPLKFAQNKKSSLMLEQNSNNGDLGEKLRRQNAELHNLIHQKNLVINQLQETLLSLEKGYNNEIMGLRKNIAELNNEAIALRKSLYQANPNGVDIGDLIKDTFSHSDKDTQFYRPTFPLHTQNLFYGQPAHNNSYYSEIHRVKSNPKSQYQRFFPVGELSMGEKFMGRRCKQASPFGGNYREDSRVANTAWEIGEMQRY